MTEIQERLEELKDLGLYRRMRLVSGPQGPRVVLDGKPVLLLCSNNYLGLADHPRVREAAADAAMRWGVGACASRLVSGDHDPSTVGSRSGWPRSRAPRPCLLFGSGYLANVGVVSALAREGEVVFSDELNHASIVDGRPLVEGGDRPSTATATWSTSSGGCTRRRAARALIVTDSVFSMDGDVAPLARHRASPPTVTTPASLVDEAHGTGSARPGRPRGRRGGRASRARST